VGSHFCHTSILENEDLVAVIDSSQSMRHEHTGAPLLFQNAVDVLQQCLFRVCVEGGGLFFQSAIS
jgi:hypothetical protein